MDEIAHDVRELKGSVSLAGYVGFVIVSRSSAAHLYSSASYQALFFLHKCIAMDDDAR